MRAPPDLPFPLLAMARRILQQLWPIEVPFWGSCKIRMIPDTPTDLFRTVLPIYSGHPYRFIADSGTE